MVIKEGIEFPLVEYNFKNIKLASLSIASEIPDSAPYKLAMLVPQISKNMMRNRLLVK